MIADEGSDGKDRDMVHSGKRLWRFFECSSCLFKQYKQTISLVIRCTRCDKPAYDRLFDPKNDKLDWYSERRLYWILHPEAHAEHIRSRYLTKKGGDVKSTKGKDPMIEASNSIPV